MFSAKTPSGLTLPDHVTTTSAVVPDALVPIGSDQIFVTSSSLVPPVTLVTSCSRSTPL